jgi:hypothetical protein
VVELVDLITRLGPMLQCAECQLWVDTGRIAANQHNGRYQGLSGPSDQEFQFSRINVRLRGNSGLPLTAFYAQINFRFRPRLCEKRNIYSQISVAQ